MGVIYASMPITIDTDPENVFGRMITGITNTLIAAAHAGVQRYVLSSSSKAVESTTYNHPHELTKETFNYEELHKAQHESSLPTPERAMSVYAAGRTTAELAFWKWVKDNKSPFVANCVVPDGNFGRIIDIEHTNFGSTSSVGMLKRAIQGNWDNVFTHLGKFSLANAHA
jgi:hypothetical protein